MNYGKSVLCDESWKLGRHVDVYFNRWKYECSTITIKLCKHVDQNCRFRNESWSVRSSIILFDNSTGRWTIPIKFEISRGYLSDDQLQTMVIDALRSCIIFDNRFSLCHWRYHAINGIVNEKTRKLWRNKLFSNTQNSSV